MSKSTDTRAVVIALSDITESYAEMVGPKALSLARMKRLGLPVPDGFCVTGSAYRAHVDSDELAKLIASTVRACRKANEQKRSDLLQKLRGALVDAELASRTAYEIEERFASLHLGGKGRVAVRSSATAEDLPGHSFAGQHDTYLGITNSQDCVLAVKRCWASLWTDRAFAYREENEIDHLDVDMAVVVQILVNSEASGVMFTVDPVSGDRNSIVIESSFGLGEAIVSGRVTPDLFTYDKKRLKLVTKTISEKTFEIVPADGGTTEEREIPSGRSTAPSIDEKIARKLAKLAHKTERAFGLPQDMEWAFAENHIYVLQSRPITTLGAIKSWDDRQVWTNANAGEVLPGVATPMTWSIIRPVVYNLFGSLFEGLGMDFETHPLIDLIAGRVYFNCNTFMGCVKQIPGMKNMELGELFGGSQGSLAELKDANITEDDIPKPRKRGLRAALSLLPALVRPLFYSPKSSDGFCEHARWHNDRLERIPPTSLADRQLVARTVDLAHVLLGPPAATIYAGVGMVYSTALVDICKKLFGTRGASLANRLLSGLGTHDNAEPARALSRLARTTACDRRIAAIVRSHERFYELEADLAGIEGGGAFLRQWHEFMVEHGHHARGETDPATPRWSEQPDYVLKMLQASMDQPSGSNHDTRLRRLARERSVEERLCKRRLRNPVARALFTFLLKQGQRACPVRENLKNILVKRVALLRGFLKHAGERLVANRILADPGDVFFLTIDELMPVHDRTQGFDVASTIAARRAEHEHNERLDPPPVIFGPPTPEKLSAPRRTVHASTMRGVPVMPGVATGKARVILNAGTDRIEPGEILIAPFTDPGWTPYFVNAAGLVTDMGGIMSHGSIVAREMGIPAVVNVGPATKIIKTGQMIQVDGTRGVVRILEDDQQPSLAAGDGVEDYQIWTNANTGEVMPDVATPFSWSCVQFMLDSIFGKLFGAMGFDMRQLPLVGLVAGRVYFNVNMLIAMVRCVPFSPGEKHDVTKVLGGRQEVAEALGNIDIAEQDIPEIDHSLLAMLFKMPGLVMWFVGHSPKRAGLYLAAKNRITREYMRLDVERLTDGDLTLKIREAAEDMTDSASALAYPVVAMTYFMQLDRFCRAFLDDRDGVLTRQLVMGMPGMQPAEAGITLWRLAAYAHLHPDIERAVEKHRTLSSLTRHIGDSTEGEGFLARWDAFMREHGHHSRGELEYANARWAERPDDVLAMVRGYLDGIEKTDPVARQKTLAQKRVALTRECRGKLRNPFKRIAFDFLLKRAQLGSVARENIKSEAVRRMYFVRLALLEVGRRLVERKVISAPDDVFLLTYDEVPVVLEGRAAFDVTDTVAQRKAEYEKNLSITPPSIVVGRFDPDRFEPDPVDRKKTTLTGMGASAGIVEGPARVILRSGTGTVKPGEILVAPFTDPGWTPYFVHAAGIVMDMGGMLSHGSIIAREYGVPAVVNVGPATKIIKSGQMLRVDGDKGVVEIL